MRDWWKPYEDKVVGYVIEKKGRFTPHLAKCVPDGDADSADDCMLFVQGSGPKFDSLDTALAYFDTNPPGIEVKEIFTQPIGPTMAGMSWLIEAYMATYKVDPRKPMPEAALTTGPAI